LAIWLRSLKTNKINPKLLKYILIFYLFMDNDGIRKKVYHELINFATQGMSENAQFSIAIAVGVFGILAILFR
jgi:hypothetical protein